MNLPFLKKDKVPGLIISKRKPDEPNTSQPTEGTDDSGLEAVSEELIKALHSRDAKGLAGALRAAFQILGCESPTNEEQS